MENCMTTCGGGMGAPRFEVLAIKFVFRLHAWAACCRSRYDNMDSTFAIRSAFLPVAFSPFDLMYDLSLSTVSFLS